MGFRCFVRIFDVDGERIKRAYDKAMNKIYEGRFLPVGTNIELGEWKDTPQLEIYGAGPDDRCAFCEYFVKEIGEENVRRNNCPFH